MTVVRRNSPRVAVEVADALAAIDSGGVGCRRSSRTDATGALGMCRGDAGSLQQGIRWSDEARERGALGRSVRTDGWPSRWRRR